MSFNLARKTVVLAKVEGTYGTDPTLSSSDAMLLYGDPNVIGVDVEEHIKNTIRQSLTPIKSVMGRAKFTLTLPTTLQYKASITSPVPFFDALLRACGLSASASSAASSSSATYTPIVGTTVQQSCAVEAYLDGLKYKVLGNYANYKFTLPAGQFNTMTFNLEGLYAEPTAVALPTAVYPADNAVVVENLGLSIGTYDSAAGIVCRSIEFDHGAAMDERRDVNSPKGLKGIGPGVRRPMLTTIVEVENGLPAAANFYNFLTTQTTKAISFSIVDSVTTPKSKVNFSAPTAQLISPPVPTVDGQYRTYNLKWLLTSLTDGGEYSLQFVESTV